MQTVTGLWINTAKSGRKFMSGKLSAQAVDMLQGLRDGDKVMFFKNENKRDGKRDPDFNLCIEDPPADGTGNRQGNAPPQDDFDFDDDIPF